MVIRELTCKEEEKILVECLRLITVAPGSTELITDDEEALSHAILSVLSWAGYKIVEGKCDVCQTLE